MVTNKERERIVAEVLTRLKQHRREQLRYWAPRTLGAIVAAATVVSAAHGAGVL